MATTGYTDLPSTAISIWVVYFLVLALEKDRRFHWFAWPLLILAALTRFTGFLLLIPILPLMIGRASIVRNLKDIALGSIFSLIILVPLMIFYGREFTDPIFPFAHAFFAVSEPAPYLESFALKPDLFWFFRNLKDFTLQPPLTVLFPLLAFLVGLGLSLYIFNLIKTTKIDILRYSFIIAALLFYIFVFFKFGFIIRQTVLVIIGILLYLHFQKANTREIGLDIIFLLWFLTYFDFHSHDPIKVERYFVVMAPGVVYAILLSLNSLLNFIRIKVFKISFSILISLVLLLAISFSLTSVFNSKGGKDILVDDAIKTSKWLKKNDRQLSKAKIYSDLWPIFSWYLKQRVDPMPSFKDKRAFNHELEKYDIDYYLTIRDRQLPSYETKAQIGTVTVLKKNASKVSRKTRILYLGMNWEHYLEEILDFKYFMFYEPGKYYLGKSLYIDGYTLEELRKYPLIILYNFRWHNRKKAEFLLKSYVKSGGSIIIEASGNNGSMPYNLEGDTFLGVSVFREALPAKPVIKFNPKLSVSELNFSPFLSNSQPWYGMTYENLDKETPFTVLATADEHTLIAEQRIDRGRIIWIGFNLVWHSFNKKNKEEQELLQRLLTYALQRDY